MKKILTSFAELEPGDYVVVEREVEGVTTTLKGALAQAKGHACLVLGKQLIVNRCNPVDGQPLLRWTLVLAERDVPPPAEPTGLGAVVRLDTGELGVRIKSSSPSMPIAYVFDRVLFFDKTWTSAEWSTIADRVVEVLSPGVDVD